MKNTLGVLVLLAGSAIAASVGGSPDSYREDVKFLASPALKGRGDGTPELDKAADFIARKFKEFGLKPVGGKSYFQDFQLQTSARLGKHNELQLRAGGKKSNLKLKQDFLPFSFASNGKVMAPVVFAGYGITAPEFQYDDYAGLDVKGKIVLLLRHEPTEGVGGDFFNGKELTIHAQFSAKATNAKQHGAAGVLLVNDVNNHVAEADMLERFSAAAGPNNSGIPFAQVTPTAANDLLAGTDQTVQKLQKSIDDTKKPHSLALPDSTQAELQVELVREQKRVHNVVGYLPGETDEYLIVGAHYDHLGLGEQFSLAPSMVGTPHLGADDNASGTAGVIELARAFSAGPKLKRGILFLTFAGEELGLLGSSYYVNHPELPVEKAVAMINMDMIGRIKDGKVYVGGAGTGSNFTPILEKVKSRYDFKVDMAQQALNAASDHTSFQTKQIPTLFFFSGLHADYHKPSDTWDKINATDAVKLLGMVGEVMTELANEPGRPQFVKVQPVAPDNPHGASEPRNGQAVSGYGPWFGSIPDFAEVPNGVKFADVTAGSPAATAGLKGGDVLVEFAGKPVQNLYDFTYLLRGQKPGDTVKVKVLRDGKPLEVDVLLTRRK